MIFVTLKDVADVVNGLNIRLNMSAENKKEIVKMIYLVIVDR